MSRNTFTLPSQRQAALFVSVVAAALIVGIAILTRPKAATPGLTWKVLPWGDSNTEGGTPPDGFCDINPGGYSYRGNLYKKLVADGHSIDYIGPLKLNGCTGMTEDIPDLDHAGYGAFSISDSGGGPCGERSPGVCGYGLLENIEPMQVKDADIILLMIGFNGRGPASALENLINQTMSANPDVKLFVGGYPNTPGDFNDMQDLRDTSKQMADQSATDGIYWVDFNRALPDGGDFIGDGVHHSQQGAAKVAQRFYDAIVESGVLGASGPTATPTPSPTDNPTPTPTGSVTPSPTPTAGPTPTELEGDVNGDNKVDVLDLSVLIINYKKTGATYSQGDVNRDGEISIVDLSILVRNWGSQ